jgi:hypothetical protein
MAAHGTISGDAVGKGERGTGGRHGAANQGVKARTTRGRAKNPAAGKVERDGKNAQGGGPGGGQ